jgi:Skp family chaperone for outer membrane proteins
MPAVAYMFAKAALDIPFPQGEILFVPDAIYNFALLDEVAATAYAANQPYIGYAACQKLLNDGKIPKSEIERIQSNMNQYRELLEKIQKDRLAFESQFIKKAPENSPQVSENKHKNKKYKVRK